jgi:mannose-6-phosphate isomerase class I
MKHVTFEATVPQIIAPGYDAIRRFDNPADEFEVEQHFVKNKISYSASSAEIIFILSGEVYLTNNNQNIYLRKASVSIETPSSAELFRVFTN